MFQKYFKSSQYGKLKLFALACPAHAQLPSIWPAKCTKSTLLHTTLVNYHLAQRSILLIGAIAMQICKGNRVECLEKSGFCCTWELRLLPLYEVEQYISQLSFEKFRVHSPGARGKLTDTRQRRKRAAL